MARPTVSPDFATDATYVAVGKAWDGQPTKVSPGAIATEGWEPETPVNAQHMNYEINNHGLWLSWLEKSRTLQLIWTTATTFAGTGAATGDWFTSYNAGNTPVQNNPGAAYHFPSVTLIAPVLNDVSTVSTSFGLTTWTADFDAVMTGDLSMSAIGANNLTIAVGLCGSTPTVANFRGAKFSKTSAQTNWQCITNDGAASTTTDSGVPPVAATIQKFKLVMQGSGGPSGARVLFYINGTLVATHTTNIESSTSLLKPVSFALATANNANSIDVGTLAISMQP